MYYFKDYTFSGGAFIDSVWLQFLTVHRDAGNGGGNYGAESDIEFVDKWHGDKNTQ